MRQPKRRLTLEALETRRVLTAPTFTGGTVTLTSDGDAATFEVIRAYTPDAAGIAADPLLDGAMVFDLAVTTVSDILVIDHRIAETQGVNVPGGWYNDTVNGSDTAPPSTQLINVAPQVAFDTWTTTPGATASAGQLEDEAGENLTSQFDVTNDGPQDRFTFSRITLIPNTTGVASAVFRGNVQIGNFSPPGPVQQVEFEYRFDAEQTISVGQSTPAGQIVGYVPATDDDGDEISYSITSGNDDGIFDIDSNTGAILLNQSVTESEHLLTIEASANGESATANVQIDVFNDNTAPSLPSLDPIELNEDVASGTAIGVLSGSDPDGDQLSYALSVTQDGSTEQVSNFSYDVESGEVRIATPFDVDVDTGYTLELTATDPAGASDSTTFQVQVIANNDTPRFSETMFTVAENVPVGGLVLVIPAVDPNGDTLSFEIIGGNDEGLFAVDPSSGEITAVGQLVVDTTHLLEVRATDPEGLAGEITLTVDVIPPDPTPQLDALHFRWVATDAVAGTAVGPAVSATDPNGDALTYTIVDSTAPGLFTYDSATNEFVLERLVNAEETAGVVVGDPSFRLVLQATNSAGLSATTRVVISQIPELTDENMVLPQFASPTDTHHWQNSADRFDVSGDGQISPIDALQIINELNVPAHHIAANGVLSTLATPPFFFDVNGDDIVAPIDALQVINQLNDPAEQPAATSSFAFDSAAEEDDDADASSALSEELVDRVFE